MQLENGVRALLIYDPVRDPDSAYHKEAERELRAAQLGGDWAEGAVEAEADQQASLAICVKLGSFSDPPDLQARAWCCRDWVHL